MNSIFQLFWRICLFRNGPETIPANNTLLLLAVIVNATLNTIVQLTWGGENVTVLRAVSIAVVSLAGTGALVWFVMMLMSLTHRLPQTLTAVFGVEIILTSISALLLLSSDALGTSVTRFVITLLTLWSLAVYGFIFHRALNIHIGLGIGMALFVVIFSMAITQTALAT
ncbi:MAG: hypothetical protein ACFHXK_03440 [bacterium]